MKKSRYSYITLTAGALLPAVAAAQGINQIIGNIQQTLQLIIGVLFIFATVMFLWGIVMFIVRSGDPAGRDKAKGMMLWGIIGLAVMAAAWGIVTIIIDYFGIPGSPSFRKWPAP